MKIRHRHAVCDRGGFEVKGAARKCLQHIEAAAAKTNDADFFRIYHSLRHQFVCTTFVARDSARSLTRSHYWTTLLILDLQHDHARRSQRSSCECRRIQT